MLSNAYNVGKQAVVYNSAITLIFCGLREVRRWITERLPPVGLADKNKRINIKGRGSHSAAPPSLLTNKLLFVGIAAVGYAALVHAFFDAAFGDEAVLHGNQ